MANVPPVQPDPSQTARYKVVQPTPLSTTPPTPANTDPAEVAGNGAEYRIEAPQAARPAAAAVELQISPPAPKFAVFVAHGMGQQIPFQTLDQIAEGLRQEDARQRGCSIDQLPAPTVRVIEIGEEKFQRIELKLSAGQNVEREVHVYEGYWAPLTEGQVTIRDVIVFLFQAGLNGLANATSSFKRWVFGQYPSFPPEINTVIYLLTTLGVVAGLVVMNAAIAAVAAARSPFMTPPAWLTSNLVADLTTTFNFFIACVSALAISLLLALLDRTLRRKDWIRAIRFVSAPLSVATFILTIFAAILAGVAIPLIFYRHFNAPSTPEIWPEVLKGYLGGGFVSEFNDKFTFALVILLAIFAGGSLIVWVGKVLYLLLKDLFSSKEGEKGKKWFSLLVQLAFIALLALVGVEAFSLIGKSDHGLGNVVTHPWDFISWPLLVAVSALVRNLLVQYVGDVAVYVTPHTLDRFNQLRTAIRECVGKTASAVYSAKDGGRAEYDQVFVVGHSLGSVIVYDTLNQLLLDDELATAQGQSGMDVFDRTRLLLTFGSPLDKIAFLFALQKNKTTEAREAVVASNQPLVRDPRYRQLPWINLYSRWDIISGSLDLYDLPQPAQPRVMNTPDPEAATLLVAHTEYWGNRLLFSTLHSKLTN